MVAIVPQSVPNRIKPRTLLLIATSVMALAGGPAVSLGATGPAPADPALARSDTATAPSFDTDSCYVPYAIVTAEHVTLDVLCDPHASTTAPAATPDVTTPDVTTPDPAFPDTLMR